MSTLSFNTKLGTYGETVTVHFAYYPGYQGSTVSPPEDAVIEIIEVRWVPPWHIKELAVDIISILEEATLFELEEKAFDYLEQERQSYEEARAEALYEEWRENHD